MGLVVWLPLLGNLNNQGTSAIQATGSNVTVNANGKLGSCYSFTSSNYSYIKLSEAPFDNTTEEFSYCCWVKLNDTSTSTCLFSNRNETSYKGISIFLNNSGNILFYTGASISWAQTIAANVWTHLAFVYKKGVTKDVYINGTLAFHTMSNIALTAANTTYAFIGASQYNATTANANYMNGFLNDVRIYNHALSVAEVHEISQGLVAHYKLNHFIQSNLLTGNINDITNWTADGCTLTKDGDALKCVHTGGNGRIYNRVTNVWKPVNSHFTVSFEGKASANGVSVDCSRSINTGTNQVIFSLTTEWKHYSGSIINTASDGGGTLSVRCNTSGATFWIRNIKLEKGDVETGFILPGESDTSIIDSSGYGHNGTIAGAPTLNLDTARYSASTYMNSTSTDEYIDCGTMPSTVQTIAFWFKKNANTNFAVFVEPSSGIMFAPIGTSAIVELATTNKTMYALTAPEYVDGEWNHIVVQKDGSTYKLWTNGVQRASSGSNYLRHTGTTLRLFNRNYTTTYGTNGYLSDFRVYATLLSETDIKQLYEMKAKIDNKHSLHTYEFNEFDSNKITKQGQIKGTNIHEIPDLFAYDSVIYIEPDGSQWAHIFHHNNPASNLFSNSNTFNSFVYTDENRWFNFSSCNQLDKFEFFAKIILTTGGTEKKYRWIQNASPLTASFDSTKVANVTRITTTGYTQSPYGGLYHTSGSAWLAMNNGSASNWMGATGAWATWNGGAPGWEAGAANAITTGSIDIYVRIDNIDFSKISLTAKSIKTNKWQANNLIEI